MFYNTENLFDTSDDTLKDDAEFLPDGLRRWTHFRYWKKLDAISQVIVASGGWEAPLLVGLCEVENRQVAIDLASRPLLLNAGYRVAHMESPDLRGIDLCLLFRHETVRILDVRSWVPLIGDCQPFTSRNLLYVKTLVFDDTLHVILCHFPSRRGGSLAGEPTRNCISELLASKIDSLMKDDSANTELLIMGDFNSNPDEPLMKNLVKNKNIINLSEEKYEKGYGTYKFRGQWEMIDQVLASDVMTDTLMPFSIGKYSFSVFNAPFLLEDDPDYPGQRPVSTFRGFSWSEGYSDHLPVLLRVSHR